MLHLNTTFIFHVNNKMMHFNITFVFIGELGKYLPTAVRALTA